MNIKLEHIVIGGLSAALGVLLVNTTKSNSDQKKQTQEILKAINASMNDISDGSVTIPEAVIKSAVDRAVDRRYDEAVKALVNRSTESVSSEIILKARGIVNESYSDLKKSILDTLMMEAGDLDADFMRTEITNRCLRKAEERFSSDVDRCVKKYVEQIKSATKSGARVADYVMRDNGVYILHMDD